MIERRDIRDLRERLRVAGVFERSEGLAWLKLGLLLSLFGGATLGVVILGMPLALMLVPLAAVALTSAVMLGHEGGHRALSRSRARNELMLHLAFPLIGGLSARYWKHKHNVLHHGHPNVVDVDEDLDLWPMASSGVEYARSGRARRWFQRRLQGWLFWPLTSFLTFTMRVASVRYLLAEARGGKLGAAWWLDAACVALHPVLWLVLPSLAFGLWPVLAFYVALWAIAGVLLSAIFVPAHLGLPIVDATASEGPPVEGGAWELQLRTTRNLGMPRWLSWLFIGLDRQVEHHLFPRIGHRRLGRAAEIVRAWARDLDLPYHQIGYFAGLREVTRLMFVAWKLDPVPVPTGRRPGPTS